MDTKRAVEAALRAVQAEDTAQTRNLLGKAYEADGQTDKAVLELQEALRRNAYEESYYFDLAHVLLRHQNFDAAIQLLEASRRIFARSAQLELALGVAYYGQRRFSEAVDSFLRTIAIEPGVAQPYVFLGRILEHADKRLPEIVTRFEARAQAAPKDFLAQFLAGKAFAAQGEQLEKAEAALRRSIALKEDFWESHYELALLLEKARKFEEAAKELERSAALNPAAPTPHYRLARIYDRLDRSDEAARERALHQKLTEEEKAAMEKHAAGIKRLELVIK
jgi:tetratricopeptide (TPR) repeat protein